MKRIAVIAGDGIGPEVIASAVQVLESVSPDLDLEKAEMGLFICLDPPTSEMEREAVVAGFFDGVHGRKRRLQIVSIAQWFRGQRPVLPPVEQLPYAAFNAPTKKPAKRPDPRAPELPLSFTGGLAAARPDVVHHLNPSTVELHQATVRPAG